MRFFIIEFYLKANPNFAGVALEMLKANPNFATARNTDEDTALHVLARNPSAFVSRPCEFCFVCLFLFIYFLCELF